MTTINERVDQINKLIGQIEERIAGLEGNSSGQLQAALVNVACKRSADEGPIAARSLAGHLRRMADMLD